MTDKIKENNAANASISVNQLKDVIRRHVSFTLFPALSGSGFYGAREEASGGSGILSANAYLTGDGNIIVSLGVLRASGNPAGSYIRLLEILGNLGENVWLQQRGKDFYEVAFRVEAAPMGITRMERVSKKVAEIAEVAGVLQEMVVTPDDNHVKLAEKYDKVKNFLKPILPLKDNVAPGNAMTKRAGEVMRLLDAGISVAITSEQRIVTDFFMASLATRMMKEGTSLGLYIEGMLQSRGIPDLISKAPGIVAIPSVALSLGTNIYDRAGEMDVIMSVIAEKGTPVLFTGSYPEHQGVFGSGQGSQANPLHPAIVHLDKKDIVFISLLEFALDRCSAGMIPLTPERAVKIRGNMMKLYKSGELKSDNLDLMYPLVKSNIKGEEAEFPLTFDLLSSLRESFRGLRVKASRKRDDNLQQKFFIEMRSGSFQAYLAENLIGQQFALDEAVRRLWSEFLTRPATQPVRMVLQGTPGTGKSEFSLRVAEYFKIPHVSIDTASMQSHHEASSLLLGSGRGIVQSYMPGKLEVMAKHHEGCVVECADLDHCEPSIRGYIADLFLHILDKGYAQTATGETISCANLIIIFTINLPGGKDETVLKGMGFNSVVSREEVLSRTVKEIKAMFSGAFVSRTGRPILFKPFSTDEKAAIFEMALHKSIATSLANMKSDISEVIVSEGVGLTILQDVELPDEAAGARGLYDLAREKATDLVVANFERIISPGGNILEISVDEANQLLITV